MPQHGTIYNIYVKNDGSIRTCQKCGSVDFFITNDHRLCCEQCGDDVQSYEMPSREYFENDILRRLDTLRDLFPFWILLGMDDEGRDRMNTVLDRCHGRVLLTDGGGGKLTDMHWRTVINHLGFVEVIAWSLDRTDIDAIKAACIPEPAAKIEPVRKNDFFAGTANRIEAQKQDRDQIHAFREKFPLSEYFDLTRIGVNEFIGEHGVTDHQTYGIMVDGKITENDDHFLKLAKTQNTIRVEFRHVPPEPEQAAAEVYRWLRQARQED
jgi:hypothetical protein